MTVEGEIRARDTAADDSTVVYSCILTADLFAADLSNRFLDT
jgi:hypothetical protein